MNLKIKYKVKKDLQELAYFRTDNGRKMGMFYPKDFKREIEILRKLKSFHIYGYEYSKEVIEIFYNDDMLGEHNNLYFHIGWIEPVSAQLEFEF